MRSVMHHRFSEVPRVEIPRSVFDRSHGYKTTFNEGLLIPFYVDEALPGDTFSMKLTMLARLATPIVPIMDNMFLDTFFFAVPLRLLWANFQKFMGEQVDPGDTTDYVIPTVSFASVEALNPGDLGDYMGIPIQVEFNDGAVSALPFRAYNLVYNQWFRDENLIESAYQNNGDGPDDLINYPVQRRGKRHDYFTSCLPWAQKGTPVDLPLGTSAPVVPDVYDGEYMSTIMTDGTDEYVMSNFATTNMMQMHQGSVDIPIGTDVSALPGPAGNSLSIGLNVPSGMVADLTNATAATINSLRQAFQLQRLFERDARGGTRYTEIIRSHFGVVSPDARLQRPEYLGGSSQRIMINPVQQTSSTDTTSPQGNLAAFGVVSSSGGGFHHSFTEHCVVMGLMCVRADLTYQQGLNRMWARSTRWDFYWPALAHLGEQEVLNQELFADGSDTDYQVFGYQERYAEYRYFPSLITGLLRSTAPDPLDIWHLSQHFTTLPTLSQAFIEENPPVDRIVAVPSEPHFIFDSFMELRCARPMPVYSVPGLIDHF